MRWCRHSKTKSRGYRLGAPYDNVFVGSDPRDGMTRRDAESYDAFVNVSDSPSNTFDPAYPGQAMHWYPVNEMGRWNLGYLFWLKKVLDFHHEKGHRVYLHCHAGAYRSPSAAILWLQSRGLSPSKARKIVGERSPLIYKIWERQGNVHEAKDALFRSIRKHPEWSLSGVLFDALGYGSRDHEVVSGDPRKRQLLNRYFWLYFDGRVWIRERIRFARDWFKGYGWRKRGFVTYYYVRASFWSWPVNARKKRTKEAKVGK